MSTGPEWDDDFEVLPDVTTDESPSGWGDGDDSNDERLLAERPPHWS
ncbi:hypothetical protein [Haloactinopolyspora sp.]|nr:hypothetical protein [Haloactinopolyspora sp.]